MSAGRRLASADRPAGVRARHRQADRDALVPDLGRGLYGPSLFYPATGTFSVFRVCNHWIGDLLGAAGLPANPVFATLPVGLIAYLRWRERR